MTIQNDISHPRKLFGIAAFLYLVFVIYGSLVPLEFRPLSFVEALENFKNIPFLSIGVERRADWVANFLLFIPLTFLISGWAHSNKPGFNAINNILLVFFAVVLSTSIEFTQLFFPQRTVSQNDIMAEAVGGLVGVIAWRVWHSEVIDFINRWKKARGTLQVTEIILLSYLILLFGYNILPLDLTISPVEIFRKWEEGRINLIPFTVYSDDFIVNLYGLATDILIWALLSALLLIARKATPGNVVLITVGISLLLEFLQLFVYSRYSDVTDLITAVAGGYAGILAVHYFARHRFLEFNKEDGGASNNYLKALGIFAGLMLLNMLIFWYPFDFNFEVEFIKARAKQAIFEVPFHDYYYGSEYRAITGVFNKVLFFLPFGIAAAWLRFRYFPQWNLKWSNALLIPGLLVPPFIIESGQLFQPDKSAQLTDFILEWIGCVIGLYATTHFLLRLNPDSSNLESTPAEKHLSKINPNRYLYFYLFFLGLLSAGLYFITQIEAVPYNVRELFESPKLFSAIVFSLYISGFSVVTYFIGKQLKLEWSVIYYGPGYLLGGSVLLFFLLSISVTQESLDDILGTAVAVMRIMKGQYLDAWAIDVFYSIGVETSHRIFDAIEQGIRFIALVGPFIAFMSILFSAGHNKSASQIFTYTILFIPWFVFCKVITFDLTPTDNIVELVDDQILWGIGGGFFLYLLLGVFCLNIYRIVFGQKHLATTILVLTSIPVTWLLLNAGLVKHLFKYDLVFSGVDFLLAPDRTANLAQTALFLRWTFLYLFLLVMFSLPARFIRKRELLLDRHL